MIKTSLLKLFLYTIFIITSSHTLAIGTEDSSNSKLQAAVKIKNIDDIITCKNKGKYEYCCPLKYTTACQIFYTACTTKEYYENGVFMITKINMSFSDVFTKIKNNAENFSPNSKFMLISIDNQVYFRSYDYKGFRKELLKNLDEAQDRVKSGGILSRTNLRAFLIGIPFVKKRLNMISSQARPSFGIVLFRNDYNNIYNISGIYNSLIGMPKTPFPMPNKGHKDECIKYNNRLYNRTQTNN